jgi:Zn-dependent peptidase ImmA (M78 family)
MDRQKQSRTGSGNAAERRILTLAGNSPPDIDIAIMLVSEKLMEDITRPPTDLEVLAQRLNVSGFDAEEMPMSGELRWAGNQFRIAYSSYLAPLPKRFTIAHELGHAVFAMTGPKYPRDGEDVERICDKFAAEFLMPTMEFRNRLGHDLTAEKLLELSDIFKAPLYATARRAAEFEGLSVFTVENQEVTWSFGKIIRKGPFYKNGYYLKDALESVTSSPSGDITFLMSGEIDPTEGRLTWTPIANGERALCLLRKTRSSKLMARGAVESADELRA